MSLLSAWSISLDSTFNNIFPGMKVIDTVWKSKQLLLKSCTMEKSYIDVIKSFHMICSSFVYLKVLSSEMDPAEIRLIW